MSAIQRYRDASSAGKLDGVLVYFQPCDESGPQAKYLHDAGHAWVWLRGRMPGDVILGAWTTAGFDLEYREVAKPAPV